MMLFSERSPISLGYAVNYVKMADYHLMETSMLMKNDHLLLLINKVH